MPLVSYEGIRNNNDKNLQNRKILFSLPDPVLNVEKNLFLQKSSVQMSLSLQNQCLSTKEASPYFLVGPVDSYYFSNMLPSCFEQRTLVQEQEN